MNIENYINEKRAERGEESFAFLAERCETSNEAPYRIRPVDDLRPDEVCVLVLPGSAGQRIDVSVFNGMLKRVDDFVKKDCGFDNARVCMALWDFGQYHNEDAARSSLWYGVSFPKHLQQLRDSIPQECHEETFNPKYVNDIFEAAILPRIADNNGKSKRPLKQALQYIRSLPIVAYCHGTYAAMRLEKLMSDKMNELGYSDKEQKALKSQLAVLAYNPDCPKGASELYMVSIESAKDDHNFYNNYMKEWLLMAPKNFGVAYLPKRWGRTLMCSSMVDYSKVTYQLIPIEEIMNRKVQKPRERVASEHGFMGFTPIKGMSKAALRLQKMANNILKNMVKNSLSQKDGEFVPLPKIQDLAAVDFKSKCKFAQAAVMGNILENRFIYVNRQKIDQYANARRSIPRVRLD